MLNDVRYIEILFLPLLKSSLPYVTYLELVPPSHPTKKDYHLSYVYSS